MLLFLFCYQNIFSFKFLTTVKEKKKKKYASYFLSFICSFKKISDLPNLQNSAWHLQIIYYRGKYFSSLTSIIFLKTIIKFCIDMHSFLYEDIIPQLILIYFKTYKQNIDNLYLSDFSKMLHYRFRHF